MDLLKKLEYQGEPIQVFQDSDGEPWFLAAEVCKLLDLSNTSKTVSALDDDEKMSVEANITKGYISSNGGKSPILINESGLYHLIIRSNKPKARKFREWVTKEVLPSIRKTGAYSIPSNPLDQAYKLAESLLESKKIIEQQSRQIAKNQEDLQILNIYKSSTGLYTIQQCAKLIGIKTGKPCGRDRLFHELRKRKIIQYQKYNPPYQRYIEEGWFEIELRTYEHPHRNEMIGYPYTLVTQKGLEKICKLWLEEDF